MARSTTTSPTSFRRRGLRRAAVIVASALALTAIPTVAQAASSHAPQAAATTVAVAGLPATSQKKPAPAAKPTVILVHGGYADASGWNSVVSKLTRDGYPVRALANPLRGTSYDAAYIRSFIDTIPGPVVLVGHSYGGAVITNAAVDEKQVKALVYIAALAPEVGESPADLGTRPVAHPAPPMPNQIVPYTLPDGTQGADIYLDPAKFRATFAADVPAKLAAQMAATQRPLSAASTQEPSAGAAWHTIPSWYLVAKQDRTISPDLERFMAKRAGSHVKEINSSHAAMVSHPDAVTRLIEAADRGTK